MNFITTPILKLTTWVKRHPIATLLVLILIFVAPPFIAVVWTLVGYVSKALRAVKDLVSLPESVAAKAEAAIVKVEQVMARAVTWLAAEPQRQYYLGAGLLLLNPLAGGVALAWAFLDKFKKPLVVTALPSPEPSPEPEIKIPEPDLGSIFDEVFGGVWEGQA